MWNDFDPWRTAWAATDALAAVQGGEAALHARRRLRLGALLRAARRAPLYRDRLGRGDTLEGVPALTKRELMQRFDDGLTDARLRLAALREFVAEPAHVGQPFLGSFTVWESSGSSGEPALFVQDAAAMAVYDALEAVRRPPSPRRWLDPWGLGTRIAFVGATGGHFASTVSVERARRVVPALAPRLRGLSFLQPLPALCRALDDWAPTVLATYPSVALLLAEQAQAARLACRPDEVWTGGEALGAARRRCIEAAFGCTVHDSYGASEFLALASSCPLGVLHLNSDWALLEPVDERGRAVPPGAPCATTLLTNLANHVQPLVRYDLGDRVVLHPARCACGSPLPALDVAGRRDDMLALHDAAAGTVRLPPLALTTVLEDDAGVFDFRLVQTGPARLSLTVAPPARAALPRARAALAAYLRAQGLPRVRIDARCAATAGVGRSGKVPRVVRGDFAPAPSGARRGR